jgi:hypothetical protein
MVTDLAETIERELPSSEHVVVFSSWALTYVRRDLREQVTNALESLVAQGRSVTWATAEPPECVPGLPDFPVPDEPGGLTVLGVRAWRDGTERPPRVIGTAHPHGEWLDLTEPARA